MRTRGKDKTDPNLGVFLAALSLGCGTVAYTRTYTSRSNKYATPMDVATIVDRLMEVIGLPDTKTYKATFLADPNHLLRYVGALLERNTRTDKHANILAPAKMNGMRCTRFNWRTLGTARDMILAR